MQNADEEISLVRTERYSIQGELERGLWNTVKPVLFIPGSHGSTGPVFHSSALKEEEGDFFHEVFTNNMDLSLPDLP